MKVNMGEGRRTYCIAGANSIPIGQTGLYTVRTWLEDDQEKILFEPISLQFEVETSKVKPT